jgi:hypothetical protein
MNLGDTHHFELRSHFFLLGLRARELRAPRGCSQTHGYPSILGALKRDGVGMRLFHRGRKTLAKGILQPSCAYLLSRTPSPSLSKLSLLFSLLCLAFISSLCLSLTFFGFFALTGPSALLSFHYASPSATLLFTQVLSEGLPFHHTDNMDTDPACPSHLQRRRRQTSSMHRGRRNATFGFRQFDTG